MDRLDFSASVLGTKASARLRNVKGRFLTFCPEPPESKTVEVYLDDRLLGNASIRVAPEKVYLGSAIRNPYVNAVGGFDTAEEQEQALRRAGYRDKPLNQYMAYMVTFWAEWGTVTFLNWFKKGEAPPEKLEAEVKPKPLPAVEPPKTTPEVLGKQKTELTREIVELNRTRTGLQEEVATFTTYLAELKKEVDKLKEKRSEVSSSIANLEKEEAELQKTVAALGEEKVNLGKGKTALKSELTGMKKELKRKLAELEREEANLKAEVRAEIEAEAKEVRAELEGVRAELTEATIKLRDEEKIVVAEAEEKVAKLRDEEGKLKEKVAKLVAERAELEEERKALEKLRDRLGGLMDEKEASERLEGMRQRIADKLTLPDRSVGDLRVWQLRTAGQILSIVRPFFKPPLTLVEKGWLRKVVE